jgi:glyoxylase-like metal-dependent hydrolase (beta-lactamase superfamily II)
MSPFRIAHAHGSPEGENSTYVLPDRGVVIDPGPPGEKPWQTLCSGFEAHDYDAAAVEDIIVTHWHADHAGNAPRLASVSDATIHMHVRDAPLLREYRSERRRRVDRDAETLELWGVPTEVIADVRENDSPSPIPDSVPVNGHTDGDTVAGFELLHTRGHTCGHIAVRDERTLYVGDAVLPMYTPNVGGSDTRTATGRPLERYLQTLDRISGLDVDREARPGHGEWVSLDERIEAIRRHHRERTDAVVDAIPPASTATPWTVAQTIFGEMSGTHAKMGAGEAAAHLGFAVQSGLLTQVAESPLEYRRP